MGVTTAGVWVTGVPSGPGAESRPVEGLGDEVPQKLKNFKNSYKKILRIFGSFTHFHLYVTIFRACRHHSTKSAKWGILNSPPCLQVGGGATAPSATLPAPTPMVLLYIHELHVTCSFNSNP